MQLITLSTVLIAASLGIGCAGSYTVTASGEAYGPDLVYVGPGVRVIADYDESIFYADNFYWRFDGGGWYRSSYYTGGWIVASPPVVIARIERPREYVRYRPTGWVARGGTVQAAPAVVARQERAIEPRQVAPAQAPAPVVVVAPPRAAPQPIFVAPPPAVTRPRNVPKRQGPPPAPGGGHDSRGDHGR